MRLFELLEDIARPADIQRVADILDDKFYQPPEQLRRGKPVLDVEIPTSSSNHFIQRFNQRSDIAKFTLKDILQLLARAKVDPSLGYIDTLDDLSKKNNPLSDVVIKGEDNLTIPVVVKPNPKCKTMTDGNPVCVTHSGQKEPKNRIIPKTVYRKGIPD